MSPDANSTASVEPPLRRAAQYVRMSTEHQQYSTENQGDKIREYAAKRRIEIVRTYADEGKSGLRIDGRPSLQRLLHDVQDGEIDFDIILVYDISRWGRFQDADESAYYEYICRRAGVEVAYCAEPFENDGSPMATMFKGLKRSMAGEYSRELSAKVFAGQCRLIEKGYRQGGPAGYGFRRVLLDETGEVKGQLSRGQHKSLQTDRVILAPGPDDEVEQVRQIYHWFIHESLTESGIAARLNGAGVLNDQGRPWNRATVHEVLTNEKYIGANVYNRVSFKLKKVRITNAPDMWIRRDQAFEAIVSAEDFYTVQGIIRARARRFTDQELLQRLRELYEARGFLSGIIINEQEGMPSSSAYACRFGSLSRAYQLIGYTPERDCTYLEINRVLRQLHPTLVADTERRIAEVGGWVQRESKTDLLTVNSEFTVSIVLARCRSLDSGANRWKVRFDTGLAPDVTVAVRMTPGNESVLDYYLLPRLDFNAPRIHLQEHNAVELESYRFDSLEYLYEMAHRTRLRWAA